MSSLSRRDGRSAVAAAAYRSASALYDEREGREHDYERKRGVELSEIVSPDGSAIERAELWNAAETAEKRKDARTAREWVLALPHELNAEGRAEVVRGFARDLAQRYGVAVDIAIHAPHREGDARNYHAHLLTTTRAVLRDAEGRLVLGKKTTIELGDRDRRAIGLGGVREEIAALRECWADLANSALARAGLDERIDHRSLEAQGLDRAATVHLGPVASLMERRGRRSDRGDQNRAVRDANAERAELGAQVVDLSAERERRERLAQEQAERERAERERQRAAEVAAQQRAAEAAQKATEEQRLSRLTVTELDLEIARLTPTVHEVEKESELCAARAEEQRLTAELAAARDDLRTAQFEAVTFREAHPWLTKLHDLGIPQKPLTDQLERELAARERVRVFKPAREKAVAQREAAEKRAHRAVTQRYAPHSELREKLRELKKSKLELELAIRELKQHAVSRAHKSPGYRDDDKRWMSIPEPERAFIDRYIAATDQQRERMLQGVRTDPQKAKMLRGLVHIVAQSRGLSRGMSL